MVVGANISNVRSNSIDQFDVYEFVSSMSKTQPQTYIIHVYTSEKTKSGYYKWK